MIKGGRHICYYAYMNKRMLTDKKKLLRQEDHLTRPPRLEGKAKNAGLEPVRKKKKSHSKTEKKAK